MVSQRSRNLELFDEAGSRTTILIVFLLINYLSTEAIAPLSTKQAIARQKINLNEQT